MLQRFTILLLMAGATFAQPAAKPADPPKSPVATAPPQLNTAKMWRLLARAQQLRQAANETPQAKEAAAADLEVQKEQQVLAQVCGVGWTLGIDQDAKSPTFQDVICVKAPPPEAPAPVLPKKDK